METGLKGRVVLITGAAGGIGSAMVQAFAEEGAKIVLHCNSSRAKAEVLAKTVKNETLVVQADLSDEAQVLRMFTEIAARFKAIDVLIANAGFWAPQDVPLSEMSLKQWNATLATNLTSAFLCLREFISQAARNHIEDPSVVLVGSTAGVLGEAGHGDYAAAKGALTSGLLLTAKNELARVCKLGRVNAVAPGWTLTPMVDGTIATGPVAARTMQTMALRKLGQASDVARAAVMLASSRVSGHTSGQVQMISGGMEGRILYNVSEIV